MADVEGATTEQQVEETTQATEEQTSTATQEEQTLAEEKVYKQKELDAAVGKAVSSLQKQVSTAKSETESHKAEAESYKSSHGTLQQEIKAINERNERLEEAKYEDDPEALAGLRDKRARDADWAKLKKEREQTELDKVTNAAEKEALQMGKKETELLLKYNVPSEVFDDCVSVEQMERIAQHFPLRAAKEAEDKGEKDSVDSGATGGDGVDTSKMTPQQLIQHGLDRANRQRKR